MAVGEAGAAVETGGSDPSYVAGPMKRSLLVGELVCRMRGIAWMTPLCQVCVEVRMQPLASSDESSDPHIVTIVQPVKNSIGYQGTEEE